MLEHAGFLVLPLKGPRGSGEREKSFSMLGSTIEGTERDWGEREVILHAWFYH
jgi:hypothetical protein